MAPITRDHRWSAFAGRILDGRSVQDIADRVGVAKRTVYRWSEGTPANVSTVRQLLITGDVGIRMAVLDYLLGGTGIVAQVIGAGDGADPDAALADVMAGLHHAAGALSLINAARAGDCVDAAHLCAIDAEIGQATRMLIGARDALHQHAQRQSDRGARRIKLNGRRSA